MMCIPLLASSRSKNDKKASTSNVTELSGRYKSKANALAPSLFIRIGHYEWGLPACDQWRLGLVAHGRAREPENCVADRCEWHDGVTLGLSPPRSAYGHCREAVQAECGERVLEVLRAAARGSHRRREDSGSERSKHHGKKDGYQATEIIDYPLPYNNHTMLHEDVRDSFEYQRHPDHSYYCESDDDIDEDEHNYKQHQDQYQSQPFQPRKGRPERTVSDQDSYSDPPQGNYGDTDMYPSYDGGATRNRGNSLSRSDPHVKSLLTEQRLRERENDLISIATVDDSIPLGLYDPSKGQPALTVMPNFQPIDEDKSNHGNGSVTSRGIGGGGARSKTAFPPRWKQSRMCHVCACGFSLVKRRHHCRNCGQSVCNQHATNRVALPKFALSEPQRVCDQCFLSGHHIMVPGGTTPSIASSYKSLPAHSQPFQTPQLNRLQFQHSR